MSQIPSIVVYDPRGMMFSKIKSDIEFNYENIVKFLKDAKDHTVYFRSLKKNDIIFKNKNCQSIIKKSKEIDYDRLDRIESGYEDDDDEEMENFNKGKSDL